MTEPRPRFDLTPISAVTCERDHQRSKWGGPEHDDRHSLVDWQSILDGELYELGQAIRGLDLQRIRSNHGMTSNTTAAYAEVRSELSQVAAVCVAMMESLDRRYMES